jgi:argininosuccinate synthase
VRVLLAYSGGLDTSYLVGWLTRVEGCAGHGSGPSTAAVGARRSERDIESRALALGAVEHRFVDARKELFERVMRWLVAGNVRRGAAYPLSVGAERGLQAEMLAREAREAREGGFDACAHGCTAAGNDQVRFEAALSTIAPHLKVLAPVRDLAPSRDDQRQWLAEQKLPVPAAGRKYSVNQGLWGVTIGGGELHTSNQALPEEAWYWTKDGHGRATLKIGVRAGVPVSLDGGRRSIR